MKRVAVYCASSTKIKPVYFEVARQIGKGLAERGIELVNGAGNMGLMQASSDACLEAGGKVIGVIPQFMVDQNWHHTGLTELIITDSMHTRKKKIADLTDGAIVLPGGCGTFDELFEIITWKQLGLYLNPIILVNVDGYFDALLALLQKAIDENFMRVQHGDIWRVASTADEALEMLLNTPQWDTSVRRFAAI